MKLLFKMPVALAACLLSVCVCRGAPVQAESRPCDVLRGLEHGHDEKAEEQSGFAEKLLREDAEAGDAEAQYTLAEMHLLGQGVPQDCAGARHWFEKAAAQGHAGAQRGLGEMFATGRCIPQDKPAAKDWFRKACNGGDQHGCDSYRQLSDAGF